jgi:hypothetical protein
MFKKLKSKIEGERNSESLFWKTLVFGKDFFWKCKLRCQHILRIIKLHKIDSIPVPRSPNEIRLFMVVRNESLRLPYIFEYYTKLGINRFFVVDNNSTDETTHFLLSQNNTHVFKTRESFSKSSYSDKWIKILLDRYGKGYWCLVADADEIFIYPHYEKVSIRDLCNFLDEEDYTTLGSFLLEIYTNKPIRLVEYRKGENPLSVFPYFDKSSHYRVKSPIGELNNVIAYKGGMRERVFDDTFYLNKFPLLKFKPGISLCSGHHFITGANPADIRGVTFHFKYSSNFIPRVLEEAKREEHFDRAIGYKKYAKKIIENPDINLYYSGSVKFENSDQLVDLEIMGTSKKFEFFVKKLDE